MAGIYIHIPFCKQACTYCDFHFSTSLKGKEKVVDAIISEMQLRSDFLKEEKIHTLYFGGGTPSLLNAADLQKILSGLHIHFQFTEDFEFTFEANPDDLSHDKIQMLAQSGVNRLSIGVQSFSDEYLKWMNRAHRSEESIACIDRAQAAGISNISIDLIYGLPGLSVPDWKTEIEKALELGVTHISAYCLTVEPNTALGYRVSKGKEKPVDEEAASEQFEILVEKLAEAGFEQYEVSNFAREGYYSKHNTAYWQGVPYLGLGPSAHSYAPGFREWNVANNMRYIRDIAEGNLPLTREELSTENRINEWIMTGLRTKWGIDFEYGIVAFGVDLRIENRAFLKKIVDEEEAALYGSTLKLTRKGLFLADGIASELFVVE